MSYNKIGIWTAGYLEALMAGDKVSRNQLQSLIDKIKEKIDEEEQEEADDYPQSINTEDLPF